LVTGWNIHHVVQSLGLKHVVRGLGFDTSSCLDNPIWRRRYLALQSAKAIVVTSPFQVERLREIGMSGGNLIPLCCGVDIPELPNRQKNRPDNNCVQFIAAGRMVPKKAPLKLLKAFFIAAKEVDEINLVYIGDGPLMQEAVEFAGSHIGSHGAWFARGFHETFWNSACGEGWLQWIAISRGRCGRDGSFNRDSVS
jgi:glycosyltransferase involved in cell wall biosynthesis